MFFKPSFSKIISTTILSILLIFFYVPFVFQYCEPIPGDFGGGGCGLWNYDVIGPSIPQISYPVPPSLTSKDNNFHAENFTFYSLPQILSHEIPQTAPPTKTASYPYSLPLSLLVICMAYILSCLMSTLLHSVKKKKKSTTAAKK